MTKGEIVILVILAFLGYMLFRYFGVSMPVIPGSSPGMGTLNNPVESGGAPNTAVQDQYGLAGIPMADYSTGPNFYVANQPWYFQPPTGGIMPMGSASTNITGGPSAQTVNNGGAVCSNC